MTSPVHAPPAPAGLPPRVTTKEASRLLGVCDWTVKRMAARDASFPQPIKIGRAVRWDRAVIEAWVATRAGLPTETGTDPARQPAPTTPDDRD